MLIRPSKKTLLLPELRRLRAFWRSYIDVQTKSFDGAFVKMGDRLCKVFYPRIKITQLCISGDAHCHTAWEILALLEDELRRLEVWSKMVQNWGPCCILPPVSGRGVITNDLKNKQSVRQSSSLFWFGWNCLAKRWGVQRDKRTQYTQEHPLPSLPERNSDKMQIFCMLNYEKSFCIYSWKVPFPRMRTDYAFGFRYQSRILTYTNGCITIFEIRLQTRRGENFIF